MNVVDRIRQFFSIKVKKAPQFGFVCPKCKMWNITAVTKEELYGKEVSCWNCGYSGTMKESDEK